MNLRMAANGIAVYLTIFGGLASASMVEMMGSSSSTVTDITANPNSGNDAHSFDNTTNATVVVPTTSNSFFDMANGTASGTVTASMGLFKGLASSGYSNTGLNEYAETDVRASASDVLTVMSSTLPTNTPVTLNFSINESGTLTSPNVTAGGAYQASATAFFQIVQFGGATSLSLNFSSANVSTLSGTLSGFVGEVLTLSQSMELTTYVSGEYEFAHPSTSTVDFSDTIHFFGNAATPGVTLASASGHDYSAPEPSAVVLLAVGLGALGLFRRFAPGL
jgi:hypothetical protein